MPDVEAFLQTWIDIQEAPVSGTRPEQRTVGRTEDISLFGPITTQELKAAMPNLKSAPVPDGFMASDLRAILVPVLKVLLTMVMLLGHLPVCLRGAKTIFILKKDQPEEPGNFRTITVAPMIVRLFHKVLAARLHAAIPLDMKQRAFIPIDGCAENVHLLAGDDHEARHRHRPLYTASLDTAKAFDSVTTDTIKQEIFRRNLQVCNRLL